MPSCRDCQAEVVFIPSAKTGKAMILNANPVKGAVLVDGNGVPGGEVDEPLWARIVDVYTDHHATCPNAADWKGKTRASTAQLDMQDHVGRR